MVNENFMRAVTQPRLEPTGKDLMAESTPKFDTAGITSESRDVMISILYAINVMDRERVL